MTIGKFINTVLLWLTLLAFGAQFFIDFSTDNVAASCIILTSALATLLYFRWSKALEIKPLSSFALFGFCVTSQLGALLAQSASWVAVSSNLHQPLVTFSMLAMYQAIALIAHALYMMTASSTSRPGLLRYTLQKLGVYTTPSALNLWFIGGMGTFSLLLSNVNAVANGLSFFAWSPFLIPIYIQKEGPTYCDIKRNSFFLVAFTVLIAIISMAFNARRFMLSGVVTIVMLSLLIGMGSIKPVTVRMLLKLGMIMLLGAALSWPASNMITAMVMAREHKSKASASEMVTKTLDNFQDPEKLASYNKDTAARVLRSSYDEVYVGDPMLARFVITKFHDNAIYFAGKISDKGSDELMKVSGDFLWAALPQPFLDMLKIDVNKDKMQFTIGDMLVNLAVGGPLGGLKTGSIFGQGWVLFGYFFPVIYFFLCFILFAALDIFSIQTISGKVEISVIGMLSLWSNFLFGISADSLHVLFIGVVRGVPQYVFLYAIVFAIARILSNLFLKISNPNPVEKSALIET